MISACAKKTYVLVNKKNINPKMILGSWKEKDKDAYEKWMQVTENEYKGVSFNYSKGHATITESIRIYKSDKNWFYEATVLDSIPHTTQFKWEPDPIWHLKFTNAKHDFPQIVAYRMNADSTITAKISTMDDSKKIFYEFQRMLTE